MAKEHLEKSLQRHLGSTVAAIKATDFEKDCLWVRHAVEASASIWIPNHKIDTQVRFIWRGEMTTSECIGDLGGDKIRISLSFERLNGKRVMFWNAISRVVSYEAIDYWLDEHLPEVQRAEANTFHTIFHMLERK